MSSTDQSSGQLNSSRTDESSTNLSLQNKTDETSKYGIRKQVWTQFERNGLVSFPRPVRGRIPNFHGAQDAAVLLSQSPVFEKAKYIKVNSDKPQENVRILVLMNGKKLYVPCPRLKEGVLMEIIVPDGATKADFKKAASRRGMLEWGKLSPLDTEIKIDLIVLGSVAVSRQGHRIGKGEGFGDLEFGILSHIGAITDETVIVTTVHDSQVFDSLPAELFQEFDVPVDMIVTPTQVINVENKLPKPKKVMWNILSQRRLNLMAVLKLLRDKEIEAGKECHLKEEDTDSETERTRRRLHQVRSFFRFPRKRVAAKSEGDKAGEETKEGTEVQKEVRKTRNTRFNRRPIRKTNENGEISSEPEFRNRKASERRRRFSKTSSIQFSLRVGNIASNVRVRDLKNALAERNVKPTDITWRGHRGFAFLHFAKPKKELDSPVQVDNIVASLQDIKIGEGDGGMALLVEPAKPITRIETTDITSV